MNEVILQEVGLRDGLQAEKQTVPFEHKAAWVGALIESGVDVIQLGSFVNPEKVPQMADTDKLFQQLVARLYEVGKASEAASFLELDAVIDPAETRAVIVRALAVASRH